MFTVECYRLADSRLRPLLARAALHRQAGFQNQFVFFDWLVSWQSEGDGCCWLDSSERGSIDFKPSSHTATSKVRVGLEVAVWEEGLKSMLLCLKEGSGQLDADGQRDKMLAALLTERLCLRVDLVPTKLALVCIMTCLTSAQLLRADLRGQQPLFDRFAPISNLRTSLS